MAQLTPEYSSNRTVREYTEQLYLPAATAYHLRSANKGAIGSQIIDWRQTMEQKWNTLHFGEIKVATQKNQHVFEVQVYLNDLEPDALRVELYAEGHMDTVPERVEMKRLHSIIGTSGGFVFGGAVSAVRPSADYTARLIPQCLAVGVPLEYSRILWQK